MKSLVVYDTEYSNTEKVARAIAEALNEHGETRVAPVSSIAALSEPSATLTRGWRNRPSTCRTRGRR